MKGIHPGKYLSSSIPLQIFANFNITFLDIEEKHQKNDPRENTTVLSTTDRYLNYINLIIHY